jgi:lysophospholipase L1-like esterase
LSQSRWQIGGIEPDAENRSSRASSMGDAPRPPRIGRRGGALLVATASVVGTLVLLGVAELGAGLLLRVRGEEPQPAGLPGDAVSDALARLDINPAPVRADPDLLWSNEPNARKTQPVNPRPLGREPAWTAEINSEGFRGAERSASADRATYLILCIGDSITFGFGVDQNDSWPEQLARRLREHHPGPAFEVINAGVPGWSWLQGLRFLEMRGLDLDPDFVVIGHGTNDQLLAARITDEERLTSLGGPFERAMRRLASRLVNTSLYRLLGRTPDSSESGNSPGCTEQIARRGSCRRVSLEQIEAAVEKLAHTVRTAGADLLVVNTDFVATPAVKASRAASERLGLPFEDLVAGIAERRRRDEDERAARLGLAAARRAGATAEPPPGAKHRIIVRVLVPDPMRSYTVEAKEAFGRAMYRAAARDDGLAGDEKAGDAVFSAVLEVPARSIAIEYRYLQDGAAEFTPLPPIESTLGGRLLSFGEPGYAPVDVFADALFMVERAHPNARGQAAIAEMIEARLAATASFAERK